MRSLTPILLIALALSLSACGKSRDAACGKAGDCKSGQICEKGVCTAPSDNFCQSDTDCPGGYTCLANSCERGDQPDMAGNNGNNVSQPDMGSPDEGGNNGEEDMNFDNIAPEVVSIVPVEGALDVPLDAAVTITFSEPMRATTINLQSVELRDPANVVVPTQITYDEAAMSATLTPTAALRQATPYRLVATTFVRDLAGNALAGEFESKFYTVYQEPAEHRTLAETWAPVIYQSLGATSGGSLNIDIPTLVDFDNNLKARDNKGKAVLSSTKTAASVYYNVVESKTTYFITYAMYYPIRDTGQARYEHDFTGAVFVVDKATEKLLAVEGLRVEEGVDAPLGFKPDDSAVTGTGVRFDTIPATSLEDGTHFPMFITAGVHEACAFPVEGNPPFCLHEAGEFPADGVVMRWGMVAQRYEDAVANVDTGMPEMTYALVPLASTLWRNRTSVGTEELWQQTSAYSPIGMDRPATTATGSAIILPNRLVSDDEFSYGKPPFQWLRTSTESNSGQWLIDPAFILPTRYDFGATWSMDYCYNIFLDLDLRGDANNPECGQAP